MDSSISNQSQDTLVLTIEGYSDNQVQFVLSETEKGTDLITLEILLYKKFGLFETSAKDLISKVKQKTGKTPNKNYSDIREALQDVQATQNEILSKVYGEEVANNKFKEMELELKTKRQNEALKDLMIGGLLLVVGIMLTMGTAGGRIFIGAIILGLSKIFFGVKDWIK